jgi:hypothetical protein
MFERNRHAGVRSPVSNGPRQYPKVQEDRYMPLDGVLQGVILMVPFSDAMAETLFCPHLKCHYETCSFRSVLPYYSDIYKYAKESEECAKPNSAANFRCHGLYF